MFSREFQIIYINIFTEIRTASSKHIENLKEEKV